MKPTIFCLTPVKNEEWIIERFLKAASLWADKIIISDQGSTDRTVEIAKRFPKVTVIDNSQLKDFNEQEMRAPLFREARKYEGKKLLISLDADELFTPNFDSPEWETMLNAENSTRFIFEWMHIYPDYNYVFTTILNECAFIDDESEYNVGLIHVPRQPENPNAPRIKMNEVAVLHFQYTNWERMERKQMWYQMYEHILYPNKSVISLYRIFHYNKIFVPVHDWTVRPFQREWISGYKQYDIDITSVLMLPYYIWDEKMIEYINTYSSSYFNRIDIWSIDWKEKATKYENINLSKFDDHRTFFDKLLLNYLKRTHNNRNKLYVRIIDRFLKLFL
jgi:hypothetical protein